MKYSDLLQNSKIHFLLGSLVGIIVTCFYTHRNLWLKNIHWVKEWHKIIDKSKELTVDEKWNEQEEEEHSNQSTCLLRRLLNFFFGKNIPEDCPGIDSKAAGKAEACAGCPNQNICLDKELLNKKKTELMKVTNKIQENLKNVKYKFVVLSGKGGVGKSTVASQIAFALSFLKSKVGLLDIDICGPSIPVLTNTVGSDVNRNMFGMVPVYKENMSIMSVGYLLSNFDNAIIWRGPKKNNMIKQFLSEVYWNDLDFLIIDTPPGTSDEHMSICSYLKGNIDGCILVTTPHILSICDVKKEIEFCKKAEIPILGVVENMYQSVLVSENYTVAQMCEEMNVAYIGQITFHKDLVEACKMGVGCCNINPESNSSKEIFNICTFILMVMTQRYDDSKDEKNVEHFNALEKILERLLL